MFLISTYIKKGKPLEYDNAPDWLVAYMKYQQAILGNTPNTIMTYFKDLRGFFQWASIMKLQGRSPKDRDELREVDILPLPFPVALEITKSDVEDYLYFLANTLDNSTTTRRKKLVSIRTFYDYLLDHQEAEGYVLASNPTDRVRQPKTPKKQPVYMKEQEQDSFLQAISGENEDRDYAIFLLFLVGGLRVSELCNIDIDDVNLEALEIRIREGKGTKERTVLISEPCRDAIANYLENYRGRIKDLDTKALFVSARMKQRLTTRSVEKTMHKYTLMAKLGGKGFTPHKLRHTTGTMLAKDGTDLLIIQDVLGHVNPATTEIYTHLEKSDISKALSRSSLATLGAKQVMEGDQ